MAHRSPGLGATASGLTRASRSEGTFGRPDQQSTDGSSHFTAHLSLVVTGGEWTARHSFREEICDSPVDAADTDSCRAFMPPGRSALSNRPCAGFRRQGDLDHWQHFGIVAAVLDRRRLDTPPADASRCESH